MADVNINVKIATNGAEASIQKLSSKAKESEKTFKKLNVSIKNSTSALKVFAGNIAANAVTALTRSVIGFAGTALDTARKTEELRTQLEVLTGSAGTANKLFNELKDFSAGTPFQLQGITEAANQLLGFGFAADEISGKLTDIGNVAAASGTDLKDISLIFGQVSAAGKLTGERLLQFEERAIPIGPAIAKTLGIAESSVRQFVSEGKVDFATFEQAFRSLSNEGGFAFGGLDKASQTLSGRISTLKDNLSLLADDVGQRLSPFLKAAARVATEFISSLRADEGFGQGLEDFATKTVPIVINTLGFLAKAFNTVFNGIRVVISGVQGAFSQFVATLTAGVENILVLSSRVSSALNINTDGLNSAIDKVRAFKEAFEEGAVSALEKSQELAVSIPENNALIESSTQRLVDVYQQEKIAAEQAANATEDANRKKVKSAKAASVSIFDALFKVQKYEELTAEQRLNNLKGTLGNISSLSKSSNKELFQIGKAAAIGQATIDGILAVQKALGSAPPPFNYILAGLVGTATAANVAQIASQQPPKFANGGIVPGNSFSGDQVDARVNSGELILNRRQQSETLLAIANGSDTMGSGESTPINVNLTSTVELDGEIVAKSVSRQVADGFKLGENV